MEQHELENSLIKTLKESELPKALGELAEIGLDAAMNEGALRDIPIVGTLAALYKTGAAMRDYLLMQKISHFLTQLSDITTDERRAMIDRLEADESYSKNVGESLILLLDRLDDIKKSQLTANAFKAYAREEIDGVMLQRLNYAVERLLLCDSPRLSDLAADTNKLPYDSVVAHNFLNAGIAFVGTGYGEGGVHPNEVCHSLLAHVLTDNV